MKLGKLLLAPQGRAVQAEANMRLNSRKKLFFISIAMYSVSVSSFIWGETPSSVTLFLFLWIVAPSMALYEFFNYMKGRHMNFMQLHASENSGELKKIVILFLTSILLLAPLIYQFRVS